ncbi:LPS export ABC transporter periplasmic protein LptC [Blochmannia endosymbiont of Camponotus sp. C-003]|uniref:LPS export ABC transporter periplasmic protein LptC n=1 Tax=unclassified Candidatus Blochmanniella TaxID=711328 RepID=UPI002023FE31|nr:MULTISPECIES: LPS export ABC transporter periplasmic protein LptC [unclassified Candidatus Blochmannia]URJ23183.1 LPS export ABC transporter periplasmic protein LptC [Blochmannia endosymbiont of Camponotus sp. C-003]URJ28652.1 LPS export ABC transporter periplasmic protein LptC [Blochmannia endosymbiont of Camponotus sp. C-046]
MFYTSQSPKKNKKYIFILILLILIIIFTFFIMKKTSIMLNTSLHLLSDHNICTHQGNDIIVNIYNKTGQLQFKLTAHCIQHFSNQKITWFMYPSITSFNNKNIPTWKIIANQAKLNSEQTLHLYGYVHINNLINNTCFQSIITNQATINLITQDIISNETVIIHGHYFYSVGMKMYANLHTQTAKLIDNAQTCYEIQHIR